VQSLLCAHNTVQLSIRRRNVRLMIDIIDKLTIFFFCRLSFRAIAPHNAPGGTGGGEGELRKNKGVEGELRKNKGVEGELRKNKGVEGALKQAYSSGMGRTSSGMGLRVRRGPNWGTYDQTFDSTTSIERIHRRYLGNNNLTMYLKERHLVAHCVLCHEVRSTLLPA
jgi:hypothetical protein